MNRRGFTLLQSICAFVIFSVVMLGAMTLMSAMRSASTSLKSQQVLATANVNIIENLQHEAHTTGRVVTGDADTETKYGFRTVYSNVHVDATSLDSTYVITIKSRLSRHSSPLVSKVMITTGVYYE